MRRFYFSLVSLAALAAILAGTSCGGGGAKSAIKNGLEEAGIDVVAVKGSVGESGQLTVERESGSETVLKVVKDGGGYVIEECIAEVLDSASCKNVPVDEMLDP